MRQRQSMDSGGKKITTAAPVMKENSSNLSTPPDISSKTTQKLILLCLASCVVTLWLSSMEHLSPHPSPRNHFDLEPMSGYQDFPECRPRNEFTHRQTLVVVFADPRTGSNLFMDCLSALVRKLTIQALPSWAKPWGM